MSNNRYIAIGDIHGCPDQLEEILEQAADRPEHRLVFLGDYIDRGPDSEAVINRIRDLDAVFIFGNHEDMILRHIREHVGEFPELFENPYINVRLTRDALEWIRDVPVPVFETPDYIFSHAGLNPHRSLEEQQDRDYYWGFPEGDYLHLTAKTVVHRHTVHPEPEVEGNRINVNTGCGSGGPLVAVVLPEMEFLVSSKSPGARLDAEAIRARREQFAAELAELEALIDNPAEVEELEAFFDGEEDVGTLEELEAVD